jgi:putative inorganic carbon (HCO3(-)) transporter
MSMQKVIRICDNIIEGCFYVLLAAVTFSISLVEIAVSIMILAWFIKKALDRNLKFLRSLPFIFLIAYFLWTVLSCFNSDYFKESFRGIFKVLEYALVFIIAATSLRKEAVIKRSFFVIAIVAIIICADGIFQYFFGYDFIRHRLLTKDDYLHRISSSFIHPNDFGAYLLVVSVIFISFLLSVKNRLKARLFIFLPLVLCLVNLFLTKSRGAWISFSAAFLVLGALKTKRVLGIFLAILLIIFITLSYVAPERMFSLADFKSGTTWERLMLWKGTINMIKEHPILGFGVNTYSRNFPKYKPAEYPDARYAHNSYLQMASEIGVVGALLFLAFLLSVLIYSLKGIYVMKRAGGIRRDYAVGLFAGLVGFSLSCVVDTHLYSVNPAVFFHLLLGFCFVLCGNVQEG